MIFVGTDNLAERLASAPLRQYKAVLNEAGIVVFPVSSQHSAVKADGISYEDNYQGNALAAIFDGAKFEIRWHRDFSAARVKLIFSELLKHPQTATFKKHSLTYQGRTI